MIVLDATNEKLQLTTSSAETIHVVITYQDLRNGSLRPAAQASQETTISSATTTDVLAAPATGYQRQALNIRVNNAGAAANTVTLLKDTNGTDRRLAGAVALAAGEFLVVNTEGGTAVFEATGTLKTAGGGGGGGDALTTNPLSQFAATTSLQLAGVISDETGSGALVFATSPTLVTPALGTPASGVLTNCTGTAAGLTAGTVTTNANLTGPITSVGNATTVADAELAAIAGLTSAADKGIQFTGVGTAATYDLTAAGKALLDDADAAAQRTTLGLGTLATQSGTFSGTSSGTNTGDQTITLTGDVTGSGTGSFAATIAADAVTYAKMQDVTATDRVLGRSSAGAGIVEEITCTSAGRALIDDADASAQRTTLGLGSLATASTINDSNWSGTDLAVANGGTGSSNAQAARLALLPTITAQASKYLQVNVGETDVAWVTLTGGGDAVIANGVDQFTGNGNWKVFHSNGSGATVELAVGSVGQVLRSAGASAAPTFTNAWSYVLKTADQSRNTTTTLADDSALVLTLSASTKYIIRCKVRTNIANATMDFKFATAYSGTVTGTVYSNWRAVAGGAATGTGAETQGIASGQIASTAITATTSGVGHIFIEQSIETNTTGTWSFQWAQNTSDAGNATVGRGSYIEYMIVV